jgi:hypothetical protein
MPKLAENNWPPKHNNPKILDSSITMHCTKSMSNAISTSAKEVGQSRAEWLRDAIQQKLDNSNCLPPAAKHDQTVASKLDS